MYVCMYVCVYVYVCVCVSMNAFDLINMIGGAAVNRMFQVIEISIFSTFVNVLRLLYVNR